MHPLMTMRTLFILTSLILATNPYCQDFQAIKSDLEKYYSESLSLRQKVMATIKKYGFNSKQMDVLNFEIHTFDSAATIFAQNIVDSYGWLGKSQIGKLANQTLFLLIQHSSKNTIEKYFPLLEKSAQLHESSLADMATMKDRICVLNGQKQIYGTQSTAENKYYPIDNPNQVNKRRRSVGLPKIKLD